MIPQVSINMCTLPAAAGLTSRNKSSIVASSGLLKFLHGMTSLRVPKLPGQKVEPTEAVWGKGPPTFDDIHR